MANKPSTQPLLTLIERDWMGMNSDSPRQGISPGEFSWLENLIPLASGTLAAVPYYNTVATLSGETATAFSSVTVNGNSYIVVGTSLGNIYAYAVGTWTRTTVATGFSHNGVTFAAFENQYLLILGTSGGLSYWDGTTTTAVGSPPWGSSTQDIAVWGGRVWVAAGETVFYSAPNSVTDYTAASGGGSFIVSDEYFEGPVVSMVPSQDYLYIIGYGAVLFISNLQLLSGNITYFQVTRASQADGVLNVGSATPFDQGLLLVNGHGVAAFSGVTRQKLSEKMNLFFSNVDYTKNISVCVGTVYNKLCFMALVYYIPKAAYYIACFFDGKWFLHNVGTQSILTWITVNGAPAAFATDGTNINQLFVNSSTNITFKAISAFNDAGDPTSIKELMKFGVEANIPSTSGASVAFTPDTESGSDSSQPFILAAGYNWLRQQSSQFGQYLGVTITGACAGITIQGFMAQFKKGASWP